MRKEAIAPILVLLMLVAMGGYAYDITVMGTRLYFEANDGISGSELHMMEIEHTITYG